MRSLVLALVLTMSASGALAQSAPAAASPPAPAAPAAAEQPGPATLDALMSELYAVLSGPVGPRDWDRFNALFFPDAVLIPSGQRPDGSARARIVTPAGYIADNTPFFLAEGFYEREIGRTVRSYGPLAQVTSAYEARHAPDDAQPFLRGINAITAFNDGKRWWLMSLGWSHESPHNPLPTDLPPPPAATPAS